MKKSIIMTIRPEHAVNVLNGIKTIEIRKTIPKNIELPCDVYLVCSKAKPLIAPFTNNKSVAYRLFDDKTHYARGCSINIGDTINGKVVCKFTLIKIDELHREHSGYWHIYLGGTPYYDYKAERLSVDYFDKIRAHHMFLDDCAFNKKKQSFNKLYAYHIDNLVIFNEPKELSEFYKQNSPENHLQYINWYKDNNQLDNYNKFVFNKAPQSWMYCWVKGE